MPSSIRHPVTALTTDRRACPLGLDNPRPEFAWRLPGSAGQVAYAVEVARGGEFSGSDIVWRSGRVESGTPFGVRYGGAPLQSRTQYSWRVKAWLSDGTESEWSEAVVFETAVLDASGWTASWISEKPLAAKAEPRTRYFRGVVDLPARVVRGRAYATALGWYRLFVGGSDLTGQALVPRWTPLGHFVEYQTYDVTEQFSAGRNVVGVVVSEGRYRGRLGNFSRPRVYGDRLAAFVQFELELADGSTVTWGTDDSWTVGNGRILSSDPMNGERVDARIDAIAWLSLANAPAGFTPVELLPSHPRALVAEEVDRVGEIGRLQGAVSRTSSGTQLVDFGQNFAGVATVRLSGKEGTTVRLLYSEVLTPDGEVDVNYLNPEKTVPRDQWFQRDEVVLGREPIEYTPWFTVHGFRYLEVEGLDRDLSADDVEGIVLSTPLTEISEFTASDPRLERLRTNVLWSLRSNFLDTPTDCPTRERSGWTGDIQVFGPTASQLVDADGYLRRFLRNLRAEQYSDGRIPPFIPSEASRFAPTARARLLMPLASSAFAASSTGWGDVAVILPWTLYRYYGDIEALRLQYGSAKAWVAHLERRAATRRGPRRWFSRRLGTHERFILDSGYHWGEWLRPGASVMKEMGGAFVGRPVVATAYFAHSASLLAKICRVLGETTDADRYERLARRVREAWQAAFVTHDGARIGDDQQDDYVRALAFELLPRDQRPAALRRLVELIEAADDHLGTGFLSTPMLLSTLADHGRADVAYRLLLQTTSPSWLSQIEKGATTTWETWEGYDEAGHAQASHNHYAFGSVLAFLHEYVAGLSPLEPGYRRLRIAPRIGGGLTSASFSVETPFGRASSSWRRIGDVVELTATVPPGTEAEVRAGAESRVVGSGTHEISWALEPAETRHERRNSTDEREL
jgi:alpha-L-rhamnosidase